MAHPLALLWGLLAIPIVLLHLRHGRVPRRLVATGMFWEQALAEERGRAAWQRWRRPVSLAADLLLLALMVLACAGPVIPPPRRLVLVVDNSESMGTSDVAPSRLGQAKETARKWIDSLRCHDQLAIVTAAGGPGVRCPMTTDRQRLHETIEVIGEPHGSTGVSAAVEVARRMIGDRGGSIVILTDGCFDGAAELAAAEGVRLIRFGGRPSSAAITRLQSRRVTTDPRTCQVLVEVASFSDKPLDCRLQVSFRGEVASATSFKLDPNEQRLQVFEMIAPERGRLSAGLQCDGVYSQRSPAAITVPAAPAPVTNAVAGLSVAALFGECVGESLADETVRELDLRVPLEVGEDAAAVTFPRAGLPIGLFFVAAAALLLAAQWRLYQRQWLN